MAEVTIKSHTRKSKKGNLVTVKSYTRRVGRKGVKSPPKGEVNPGDELKAKMETAAPKYTGPKMTKEEILAWDAAARRMSAQQYGKPKNVVKKSEQKQRKSKKDIFSAIEEGVSSFVNRFSGKKYKKIL